jgi:hypothetical protein
MERPPGQAASVRHVLYPCVPQDGFSCISWLLRRSDAIPANSAQCFSKVSGPATEGVSGRRFWVTAADAARRAPGTSPAARAPRRGWCLTLGEQVDSSQVVRTARYARKLPSSRGPGPAPVPLRRLRMNYFKAKSTSNRTCSTSSRSRDNTARTTGTIRTARTTRASSRASPRPVPREPAPRPARARAPSLPAPPPATPVPPTLRPYSIAAASMSLTRNVRNLRMLAIRPGGLSWLAAACGGVVVACSGVLWAAQTRNRLPARRQASARTQAGSVRFLAFQTVTPSKSLTCAGGRRKRGRFTLSGQRLVTSFANSGQICSVESG